MFRLDEFGTRVAQQVFSCRSSQARGPKASYNRARARLCVTNSRVNRVGKKYIFIASSSSGLCPFLLPFLSSCFLLILHLLSSHGAATSPAHLVAFPPLAKQSSRAVSRALDCPPALTCTAADAPPCARRWGLVVPVVVEQSSVQSMPYDVQSEIVRGGSPALRAERQIRHVCG